MLNQAKPDLAQRIARFKPMRMPFDGAGLSAAERQVVDHLVAASRALESIYWRQSDPTGLALYKALTAVDTPATRDLRHYLSSQSAIVTAGGRYKVDYAKIPDAIQRLARELLERKRPATARAPKRDSRSRAPCRRR